MSRYSKRGLQINTLITVATKNHVSHITPKKAVNDGTAALWKLFGLNSHSLGCDGKRWGVSTSRVPNPPAAHTDKAKRCFQCWKPVLSLYRLFFPKYLQMQTFDHLPILTCCLLFREELDVKSSRFSTQISTFCVNQASHTHTQKFCEFPNIKLAITNR